MLSDIVSSSFPILAFGERRAHTTSVLAFKELKLYEFSSKARIWKGYNIKDDDASV